MQPFKRGDIVKQEVFPGLFEFFHVEYAHPGGALDAIADDNGKSAGLSALSSRLQRATMAELLEHREQRAKRAETA